MNKIQSTPRRWFTIGSVFLLIALLAPFFGLLGTVIGMIRSFGDLARVEPLPGSQELAGEVSFSFGATFIGLAVSAVAATIGLGFTAAGMIGHYHEKSQRQRAADQSCQERDS